MDRLLPCSACSRHVRIGEAQCPFCGARLDFSEIRAPTVLRGRYGRSVLFAFGALVGASFIVDCSSSSGGVYGAPAPPIDAGGTSDAGDGSSD